MVTGRLHRGVASVNHCRPGRGAPHRGARAPRQRQARPVGPARAGCALWRIAGDADAALPALTAAWQQKASVRQYAARCLAEMAAVAAPALPLVGEELGQRRRHNAQDGGWGSDQVRGDEVQLPACEAVSANPGP
jgi:hypothetical protein